MRTMNLRTFMLVSLWVPMCAHVARTLLDFWGVTRP